MKREIVVQGRTAAGISLLPRIEAAAQDPELDRLDVAMAYVTVSGVEALLDATRHVARQSRWVAGLDDAITQPGAIEHLRGLKGATVKVASLAPEGRRFHPKVLRMWSSKNPERAVLIVGSGNLTFHGLRRNGEAACLLTAETAHEAGLFTPVWDELWRFGRNVTVKSLAEYRARYDAARKLRRKLVELGVEPPEPTLPLPGQDVFSSDAALVHPAQATTCWIDIGSGMSGGREIEFKRSLVLFFNFDPSNPGVHQLRYTTSDGNTTISPFVFRSDSRMWRTTLRSEVTGAGALRVVDSSGQLARSPYAAVFNRTEDGDRFGIRFVQLGSSAYRELERSSRSVGTLARTQAGPSGRAYGFY